MESILSSKVFATRRGTIMLGIGAAVLAAIALLVYLNHYRSSVNSGVQPMSVLVAQSLIQKGTPGAIVGSTKLFQVTSIPRDQVKNGAYVDPKTLTGQVAAVDIYPGQQLTAADFTLANVNALTQRLARDQRAVVVPLDAPAEVGGQVLAGDRVDVWVVLSAQAANGVSRPVVREVLQNMYVMTAGTNITIRATPKQAGMLIFASSNAKIWLVLRPAVGSTTTQPPQITSSDLVGG
jgi:Flp pilus assembly protein CpaB